ncbi:MAG: hypothetical protein IKP88_21185 [Lachnospiraceae bacterium]|nr:hypothetical protein [Lachnospiraceae bacterium]
MTTQEQIQYLEACFEAEQGLYTSTKMISFLGEKILEIEKKYLSGTIPNISDPPKKEEMLGEARTSYENIINNRKKRLTDAYLKLNFKEIKTLKAELQYYEELIVEEISGKSARDAENEARKIRNEKAYAEWATRNAEFKLHFSSMVDAALDSLESEKQKFTSQETTFNNALETLYGRNILHHDFQHAEAVFQLKKYLEMGIAKNLTGERGACRFYMEELRANRITGSIEKLRLSVEKGFSQVLENQKGLYNELVSVNNNFTKLQNDLNSSFSSMVNKINTIGENVTKGIEQGNIYHAAVKDEIYTLSKVIQKSAYNQYLIDRTNYVENYLGFILQNPIL